MEAEIIAGCIGTKEVAWLWKMWTMIEAHPIEFPINLAMDNQGAIFLAENPATDRRTKHIEIRYHYIREFYESGETEIYYVASEAQLADALTKNVPLSIVEKFRSSSGMVLTS